MEPLLNKELDHITKQLESVRELLEKRTDQLKKSAATSDERLQESWGYQKEVATLKRMEEGFNALKDENDAVMQERSELREGLSRLLDYTKALSEALREEDHGQH